MTFLVILAALAAPHYDVRTLGGESSVGAISAIDADSLVLSSAQGEKKLPLKELLDARQTGEVPAAPRQPVELELIDGTRISGQEFGASAGKATVVLSAESSLELPVKALRSVRFFDPAERSDKLDGQWRELAKTEAAGDLLVIRKKGEIDSTDGVVGDVSDETVAFTLDGDKIDVKRTKVEGILFAQVAGEALPEAICSIVDAAGARWNVKSLALADGKLQLETPVGAKTSLPLEQARQFDFSGGKIVYLSDLEPESFAYQPFFSLAEPLATVNDFYRLRRDIGLEKSPLRVGGKTYSKGIALHSRSTVEYRLPGKFRKFTAVVGIDDAVKAAGGDVALEILGDGKSLWKGSVRGSEAAQTLDLDLAGVKRLKIVADYGAGQDVADHLNLCEAKVMK
ncbi:MAG: NPCBM/NEW2 domain-containing protein [Pirellulaceae bacterium]|nr:NPCBM/NEW2 domain-containing protein [Pirellulaceae bacterium]